LNKKHLQRIKWCLLKQEFIMASKTPYTDMAKKILEHAQLLDSYLAKHDLPVPSFDQDAPTGLPPAPEVQIAKLAIQDTISDLQLLVAGPREFFTLLMVPVSLIYPHPPSHKDMLLTGGIGIS
jgi:hypothetical protein